VIDWMKVDPHTRVVTYDYTRAPLGFVTRPGSIIRQCKCGRRGEATRTGEKRIVCVHHATGTPDVLRPGEYKLQATQVGTAGNGKALRDFCKWDEALPPAAAANLFDDPRYAYSGRKKRVG